MITFNIVNNKLFMNYLLKSEIFDTFEVREAEIHTFVKFKISGIIEKGYFSISEQESILRPYCLWSELKSTIFQLIKGNKQPSFIKIIFSYDSNKTSEISENAASLFLNITFENGKISCITGSSEKNFSFEKKVQNNWDYYIKDFFKINKIDV